MVEDKEIPVPPILTVHVLRDTRIMSVYRHNTAVIDKLVFIITHTRFVTQKSSVKDSLSTSTDANKFKYSESSLDEYNLIAYDEETKCHQHIAERRAFAQSKTAKSLTTTFFPRTSTSHQEFVR